MKKILSILICISMLIIIACPFFANAAMIVRDEILKGTLLAFDSEEGYFNTTTYYVKLIDKDKEEFIYALNDPVYFEDRYCDAEDITYKEELLNSEITYVIKGGKIYCINPVMPNGAFDSVKLEECYKDGDMLCANLSFENLVDNFTLVITTYNDEGIMCAAKSFEVPYTDSYQEFEMDSNGGNKVKLFFLESIESMKPIYEVKKIYIPTEYGYLLDIKKSEGEYRFEIFTTEGVVEAFECANEIIVDEESCVDGDSEVTTLLGFSAESANANYEAAINVKYHQPVMYALNEQGEIAEIDTVVSGVNEGISKLMNDEDYNEICYIPYSVQKFKLSSKAFENFKVASNTKIMYVPDDRSDVDEYIAYESYKEVFANAKSYHVEAYGLSPSYVAALVLVYKDNSGKAVYTSSSPMLLVEGKTYAADGTKTVTGYSGTSYSLLHENFNEGNTDEDIKAIGKGDIIRYILDSKGEISNYQLWYDADNALQKLPCDSMEEAIASRILEVNATSSEPVVNMPEATFRLQYGTVCDIEFSDEGDRIKVTASIADDKFDMVTEGDGVAEWEMESNVKFYKYDGEKVSADADPLEIKAGETEVIAYSASGKLRAVYVVNSPVVSNKSIAAVQTITKRATGYEIIGYGDGGRLIVEVDEQLEPIVESITKGNIIAYVPDGDTIKDIEVVFKATKTAFLPEDGESLIATDTKELLAYGLSEYTTEGAVVNGISYTVNEDTNYLLMKYAGNIINYGLGKHMEMKNEYVLIRVKADNPTVIADVVIFQGIN